MNIVLTTRSNKATWRWACGSRSKRTSWQGNSLSSRSRETRSNEASAKFHAICMDFARSGVLWAGKRRTQTRWKVLLIRSCGSDKATKVVPGLEASSATSSESSPNMSVRRMNSLIEYSHAMGTQLGVRFSAPRWMEEHA